MAVVPVVASSAYSPSPSRSHSRFAIVPSGSLATAVNVTGAWMSGETSPAVIDAVGGLFCTVSVCWAVCVPLRASLTWSRTVAVPAAANERLAVTSVPSS